MKAAIGEFVELLLIALCIVLVIGLVLGGFWLGGGWGGLFGILLALGVIEIAASAYG